MKILLVLGGFVIIGGLLYLQLNKPPGEQPPATFEPYRATLTGTYLCLPHTNTSGPQTLECALGLQAEDGIYYALDFNTSSSIPPNIPTGSKVTGSGLVTPVENLSSDHWKKYPIKAIFSVTDSFKVL